MIRRGAESTPAGKPAEAEIKREVIPLTRALRSHQLWLTVGYLGLLALMARGYAG